jgi:hypothetical protein
MDHSKALKLLGDSESVTIAHKTFLTKEKRGNIGLFFHQTEILTFLKNGGVRVNHGGFPTQTTVKRMNQYLPDPFKSTRHEGRFYLVNQDSEKRWEITSSKPLVIASNGSVRAG